AFLRSHAGEDAAICRDLGATLIDHDRTWTEPAMSEANRRGVGTPTALPAGRGSSPGGSIACGTGRVERSPAAALSTTLPGVAVATSRGSRPRIAAHPRPSASAMLAPAIPPAPIVRPSASSLPTVPSRPPSAALLIAAALAAGITTFLLATLL
ncbi:MAG TPA: hypothetical protein VK607_05520, partial [Kofleriaceae bacterium]|nr:hypothetical protein [Kofleriaceae bacterium]